MNSENTANNGQQFPLRLFGLILGVTLFLIILFFTNLDPSNPAVTRTAAVAVLMAVWWITEAIPIAVTALIPVVLFPFLGVMSGKDVASNYFNSVIFLFIGGFIVALAMQRWNLHKRIALKIIMLIGAGPSRVLLGFMAATAFLSMWISNTATTMMMVPIALAVISKLEDQCGADNIKKYAAGLLIGIAYAASIGGTATLIGTPPNIAFRHIFSISFPNAPDITFAQWFVFGTPFAVFFLVIAWLMLYMLYMRKASSVPVQSATFKEEYKRLGKMSYEEKAVLVAFVLMALLWLFRKNIEIGSLTIPGWSNLLLTPAYIDDGTVAIFISIILFIIPAKNEKTRIMNWRTARGLPWGIVLLFGGGFALAEAFKVSKLSEWLGGQLAGLHGLPVIIIVLLVCLMITFLTELTSNTATTQMILPILASMALAVEVNPLILMIPATLSASCAFMLPVATPPNAIIFGTERISMMSMAKTGFWLNIIGAFVVTAAVYLIGKAVFGIDLGSMPGWATP